MANEIQFPTSPTNGNIYSMGGRNYRYDSAQDKFVAIATATIVEGGGVTIYATIDDLPLSGNTQGDLAHVTANNTLYFWNGSGWYKIALINNSPSISNVNSSYTLSDVGADTVITMIAEDPEGLAITYSIASDTSGNTATVVQGTGANTNIFTITPSTDANDNGTFSLTFRASDGVNIATAPASFTLNILTTIPNSNYTTALITSVGANLADNNDFVDSSTNSHTITAAGNVTQTTFSPYRHGGYSTYFDGTGDYITAPSHTSFDFGTGDFTIEMWINIPDVTSAWQAFISRAYSNNGGWRLYKNTGDNNLRFYYTDGGSTSFLSAINTGITNNTWHHIAVVRNSSTTTIYVDGVSKTSGTITTSLNPGSYAVEVGSGVVTSSFPVTGNMADVRIVKGTAVYTANFSPPTERLTAITNTSLLTCHLPYIADGSTNGHSITVNGNTKTVPFAPYEHQEYSSNSHGGSMYFDGNGDYLKVTNTTTSVSGDFTIECWVNFSSYASSGANSRVFSMKPGGNTADNLQLLVGLGDSGSTAGSVSIWTNAYTAHATTVVADGSWHHIAVTRESGTVKIYIDGVVEGSGSNSTTFDFSGHKIGTRDETADATSKFSGIIADFRTVVGTAVYTSTFTPPSAPLTDVTNTLALVQGTNAGIIDKSQSIKDYTNSGSISSTAQTKYLTSSIYFDGVNDYARWTNNDGLFDLGFNGEPFTIEHWHYFPSIVNGASLGIQTGGGAGAWSGSNGHQLTVFFYSGAATLFYQWWNGSGRTDYEFNHGGAFTAGTWQHFATVYDGTNLSTYVDGTRIGHRTSGNTFGSVTTKYATLGSNATTNQGLSEVYYSDVRVTKGLARYSGTSFTPPTEALLG